MTVKTNKSSAAKSDTQEATGKKQATKTSAKETKTETSNTKATETAPVKERQPVKLKLVGCRTYALRGANTSFVRGPIYTIADEDMADKLLNKRGVNGRKLFKQVTVKAKPKSERRDDATVGEAVDAMHQLDDSEENYTEDGLPDTRVLSEIIGRHVSADTRDKAFEVFQEEEDDEDNADSEQVEV